MPDLVPLPPSPVRPARRRSILGVLLAALMLAGCLLALGGVGRVAHAQSQDPDAVLYVTVGGMTSDDCKRELVPAVIDPPVPAYYSYANACDLDYAIQVASDDDASPDTLWIAEGDYSQSVEITKSIHLVGGFIDGFVVGQTEADPVAYPLTSTTRILGAANLPAITIEAPLTTTVTRTVTLDGLYVQHQTAAAGQGISVTAPISPNLSGLRVDLHVVSSWVQTHTATTVGGGLVVDPRVAGRVGVTGTLFSGNQVPAGGAIWLPPGSRLYGSGSRFQDNTATGDGGALYTVDSTVALAGSMTGNSAGGNGGGIAASGGSLVLDGLVLIGNTAQAHGGALYRSGGNLTLSGNQVMTNTATTGSGGGIAVTGAGTVNLAGVTWLNNQATSGMGGAAYVAAATVTFSGSPQVRNNRALHGGGAYLRATGSVTVGSNGLVRDNQATGGMGGAFYIDGATTAATTITNNTIVTNTADVGGGLMISATVGGTLGPNVIQYNRALVGSGGGLYVMNSTGLTAGGMDLQRNTAQRHGGGAYLNNSQLSGTDPITATYNTAQLNGGGLHLGAGAGLTVTAATFLTNTAQDHGGGLYADRARFAATTATTAQGNVAVNGSGGALYFTNPTTDIAKNSSASFGVLTLLNNRGQVNGGGFYAKGGEFDAGATRIEFNRATTGNGGGFYLTGDPDVGDTTLMVTTAQVFSNTAQVDGGGGYADPGRLIATSSTTVLSNTATTGKGGGLYVNGGGGLGSGSSTLAYNRAALDGGGLFVGQTGVLNVTGAIAVHHNRAQNNGGGIAGILGALNASGAATVYTNTAVTGSGGGIYSSQELSITLGAGSAIRNNTAKTDGGGVYGTDMTLALGAGSTVNNNIAQTGSGGGIYLTGVSNLSGAITVQRNIARVDGGGIYALGSMGVVSGTISQNTAATGYGGGVYAGGSGTATLSGVTIADNIAQIDGGGVFLTATTASLVVENASIVTGNHITTGVGGGIAAAGGNVTVRGSTVTNNHAQVGGGGVYLTGGALTLAAGASVTANKTVTGGGGGLAVISGTVTISASVVSRNEAALDGGGLYAPGGNVTVRGGAVITGNTISLGRGGGLYVDGIRLDADDADISGNVGAIGGGGVYADALYARIANSTLIGNNASISYTLNGPGGAAYLSADLVELTGNLIEDNETSGNGGALALEDVGAAAIISNTISGNTVRQDITTQTAVVEEDVVIAQTGRVVAHAGDIITAQDETEGIGGGLYVYKSSAVFENNIVVGNSNVAGEGGGFYVSGSAITMTNNVVAANSTAISTTYGAGIFVIDSSALLQHVTIADNVNTTSEESTFSIGLYATRSASETTSLSMTNSIIAGHELGLMVLTGATAGLRNNLFYNSDGDWDGPGVFEPSTDNRVGDPRFMDSANGDYHIQRTSEAFDMGLNIGVATDLEGVLRPRAFGVDAGAYEQHYPAGVHFKVTATPQFVGSGETIEYKLQLVNHSAGPLSGVGLNFALPGPQSATGISGPGCSGTGCSFGNLAVDQLVEVTLRATATGTPPPQGFIEMVTTVNVTGVPGPDMVASDTTRTVTTRLQRCRIQYAGADYPTLQAAISAVNDFDDVPDIIRVAGYCGGSANVTKKMTIQGGWDFSMTTLDPVANVTTIDAANTGRVLKLTNDIAPTIENLTLRNGSASGLGGGPKGKDAGGVVYIQDAKATLRNVRITDGSASSGGCVFVARLTAPTIEDSIIENCKASEGGGGLYANDGSPQVLDTIIRNSNAKAGGGLYLRKGNAIINGATISNNRATGTASYLEVAGFNVRLSMGGGGGVNFDESKAAITRSTLTHNSAKAGGAIFADNSPGSVSASILSDNEATGSPTIVPIIILVNKAGGGGAIYAQRSDMVIEYNVIQRNTSAGPGGAIHLFNGTADGKINGNYIGYNSASKGAAVYAYMDPDTFKIFVLPLSIPDFLIPILLGKPQPDPPKVSLQNNTIAHNQGGSAVHFYGSSYGEMIANVMAFNTGTGVVAETQVLPYLAMIPVPIIMFIPLPFPVFYVPKVDADYNLWYGNGGKTSSQGVGASVSNTNERTGDPALKDDGYHIKRISAAYNTGKNTGIPVDLDDETRPQADITDIGADEYPALGVRYVAPGGGDTGGNFCRDYLNPCGSLQVAIDSALEGDLIKMAGGAYSGVTTRLGQTQMGFITKTLTIQGGYYRYTTDNDVTDGLYTDHDWEDPHADVNPTILDAGDAGRVFYILDEKRLDEDGKPIKVEPTLSGLVITNGNSSGQKGPQGNLYDAGGGIYLDNTTATIRDVTISSNVADYGGGVYLIASTLQLDDVTVSGNQANERGGGFYLDNSDKVTISSITIEQNKAPRGAGLYLDGSDATLQFNVISGNGDSAATVAGGGLYLDGSQAQVISNTVTANNAAIGGGLYVVNSTALIKGNTIATNRSTLATAGNGRGGGCYLGPGSPNFTQNILQTNEAVYGGGCYLEETAASFTGNQVLSNIARTSGGGLYLNNSSDASVRLNTVTGNTANGTGENDGGGGFYLESSNSSVQENVVSANQAARGGGFYLFSFSNAALNKNTITQNTANLDGGGAYIKLSNANLTENIITANATAQGNGGGVYVKLSGAQFTKNTVNDNNATLAGGGVYLDESGASLQEDSVQSNHARNGGGVYLFRSNTAHFSKVTISNNRADLNGGGIYLNLSNIPLEDHVIEDNAAGLAGGGLYLEESLVSLNRNIVRGNQAGERGGGVAVTKRSHATMGSNAIVDNQAGTTGSGVYVSGSQPTLIHTTLARNTGGDGTGIAAESQEGAASTVKLINTILANQTLAVRAAADNTISLTATLWDGNQLNWKLDAGKVLTGSAKLNFFGSARFQADGIHLQKDSKAVSVGVVTDVSRDVDGDGRPQGNGPELGADELPADCLAVASSDLSVTYTTVQAAIDAADPGDEVRIAGTCVGAVTEGGTTQLAYIYKQINVRGGYTPTNWLVSYPITQPTFLDAKGAGRVIFVTSGVHPLIESLNLANGNAAGQGGGPGGLDAGGVIYARNANPTLRNLTLVGGAAYYGAGLYLQSSTATLTGSKLEGNAGTKGGGVFLRNANATLRDNTVINNLADSGAGLFLSFSQAVVEGNDVVQNTATAAGGGFFLESSAATIRSNLVATNTALAAGGIYVDSASPQITRNTIQGNTGQNAGGLYLSGSSAAVNGNTVVGNSAGIGGGIYVQAGQPALDNNVIAQNSGQIQAAGLYILSSSPKLRHNTVAANTGGDGSGMYVTDLGINPANIDFVNNIMVDHSTAISITAGNKVTIRSALLNNNTRDWAGDGIIADQGSHVRADPRFVNAAGRDYHLESSSPARDRGATNAGIGVDFDGQTRPADQGYDIGADEFVFLGLQIVAQTVPEPVVAGAPFSFIIRVVNIGNIDQTASVTITLPSQMTPSGVLTWTAGIARGDTWVKTIDAKVTSSFSGQLTAILDVSTAEGEGETVNVPIAVDKPDFAVLLEAEATPSPVTPGSELVYQIRVSNVGNQSISPAVTVELPAAVSAAATMSFAPDPLGPGGAWTKALHTTVATDATGTLRTIFRVTTLEGPSSTYTLSVPIAKPGLTTSVSATPDPVLAGRTVTYTLKVANTGNIDFTGIITFVVPTAANGRPLVAPGADQVYRDVSLPAGGEWTQTLVLVVEPGYTGDLTSHVIVATSTGLIVPHEDVRQVVLPTRGPTIRAVRSGAWDDPNTWDPARVPNADDIALVQEGVEVTVSGTPNPIALTGLINNGTIFLNCAAGEPMVLKVSEFIENNGLIRGADAQSIGEPGCPVEVQTLTLDNPGVIRGGDGADGGLSNGVLYDGGDGGPVSVFAQNVLNDGTIRGGDGGNVPPPADSGTGGDGGNVLVVAGPPDPGLVINRGLMEAGDGGDGPNGGDGGAVAMLASAQLTIDGGAAAGGAGGDGRDGGRDGADGGITTAAAVIWDNGRMTRNGDDYAFTGQIRPRVRGAVGALVLLPVEILNTGINNDTYLLLWSLDQEWAQEFLPQSYRVRTLQIGRLFAPFQIPLTANEGDRALVTIEIGSRGNLNLSQELSVIVAVGEGERVLMPTVYGPNEEAARSQAQQAPAAAERVLLPVVGAATP